MNTKEQFNCFSVLQVIFSFTVESEGANVGGLTSGLCGLRSVQLFQHHCNMKGKCVGCECGRRAWHTYKAITIRVVTREGWDSSIMFSWYVLGYLVDFQGDL